MTDLFSKEQSIATNPDFIKAFAISILKTPSKVIIQSMEAVNFICKTFTFTNITFYDKQNVIDKLYSLIFFKDENATNTNTEENNDDDVEMSSRDSSKDDERISKCKKRLCDNFYKMKLTDSELETLVQKSIFTISQQNTSRNDYENALYFVRQLALNIEKTNPSSMDLVKDAVRFAELQTEANIFSVVKRNLIDFLNEDYEETSQRKQHLNEQLKEQLLFISLLWKITVPLSHEEKEREQALGELFNRLFMSNSQDYANTFSLWVSNDLGSNYYVYLCGLITSYDLDALAQKFSSSGETLGLFKNMFVHCKTSEYAHSINTLAIRILMHLYGNKDMNSFKTLTTFIKQNGVKHPEKDFVDILSQCRDVNTFRLLLNAIQEVIKLSLTPKQQKFFTNGNSLISSSLTPSPSLSNQNEQPLHFNIFFKNAKDKTLDVVVEKNKTLDYLVGEMFDLIETHKEDYDISKLFLDCLLEGSGKSTTLSKRVYASWYSDGTNGKELGELFKDGLSWRVRVSAPHRMNKYVKETAVRNPKKTPRVKQKPWFQSAGTASSTVKYSEEQEKQISNLQMFLPENDREKAISILLYFDWDDPKVTEFVSMDTDNDKVNWFHETRMKENLKSIEQSSTEMDVEDEDESEDTNNAMNANDRYIWDEDNKMRNALYIIFSQSESVLRLDDTDKLALLNLFRYFRPPPLSPTIGEELTEMIHNGQHYLAYYWVTCICDSTEGKTTPNIDINSFSLLLSMLHGDRTIDLMLCLAVLRAYRIFGKEDFAFDALENIFTTTGDRELHNAILTELYLGSYKGTESFLTSESTLEYVLLKDCSPALCEAFAQAFLTNANSSNYSISMRALSLFTAENVALLRGTAAPVFFETLTRIASSFGGIDNEDAKTLFVDKCGIFYNFLMSYATESHNVCNIDTEMKGKVFLTSDDAFRLFKTLVNEVRPEVLAKKYDFTKVLEEAFKGCSGSECIDEGLLKYITFILSTRLVPKDYAKAFMKGSVVPYISKTTVFLRDRSIGDYASSSYGVDACDLDGNDSERVYNDVKGRYPGIKNMGNTCYLNSILQQLYFTEGFRSLVMDDLDLNKVKPKDDGNETTFNYDKNFVEGLKGIFTSLSYGISPVQYLTIFLSSFDKTKFEVNKQQDAVEFFSTICERIETIADRYFDKEHRDRLVTRINSIFNISMDELFLTKSGEPSSGHITSTQNAFQVDICNKSISTIEDGIEVSLKEEISDIDKVKILHFRAENLPQTLVLQLKRFGYNSSNQTKTKIPKRVSFDTTLDISRFSTLPSSTLMYRLRGVVVHSGTSEHGHYYSFINTPTGWFRFDDNVVTTFNPENIPKECFGSDRNASVNSNYSSTYSAYMLFYERIATTTTSASMEVENASDIIVDNVPYSISNNNNNNSANTVDNAIVIDDDANARITDTVIREVHDRHKTKCSLSYDTLNFVYSVLALIDDEDCFDTDELGVLLDYVFRALSMRVSCAFLSSFECGDKDVLFITQFERFINILAEITPNTPVNEEFVRAYIIANSNSSYQEMVRAYATKFLQTKTKVCPDTFISQSLLNEVLSASSSTANMQYLLLLERTLEDMQTLSAQTAKAVLSFIKTTYSRAKEDSCKVSCLKSLSVVLRKICRDDYVVDNDEDGKCLREELKYFYDKPLLKEYINCLDGDSIDVSIIECREPAKLVLVCLCKNNFVVSYTIFRTLAKHLDRTNIISIIDILNSVLKESSGVYKNFISVLMCNVILDSINKCTSELIYIAIIPTFLTMLTDAIFVAVNNFGDDKKPRRDFMTNLKQNVLYLQDIVFGCIYKRIYSLDLADELPKMPGYFGFLCEGAEPLRQMYPKPGNSECSPDVRNALDSFIEFNKMCKEQFGISNDDDDGVRENNKKDTVSMDIDDDDNVVVDENVENVGDNDKVDEEIRRENEWLREQIQSLVPKEGIVGLNESGIVLSDGCLEYAKRELGINIIPEGNDNGAIKKDEGTHNTPILPALTIPDTGYSLSSNNANNQVVAYGNSPNEADAVFCGNKIDSITNILSIDRKEAIGLLKRASGDVERAINLYYMY